MTKLETLQYLAGERNALTLLRLSDEKVMQIWNTMYKDGSSRFQLIKIGEEFSIESCTPIHDFTKDAMEYFMNN
jgi:hypothetical protein